LDVNGRFKPEKLHGPRKTLDTLNNLSMDFMHAVSSSYYDEKKVAWKEAKKLCQRIKDFDSSEITGDPNG